MKIMLFSGLIAKCHLSALSYSFSQLQIPCLSITSESFRQLAEQNELNLNLFFVKLLKMSVSSQKVRQIELYESYREYVEFINQLRISQPFAEVLLAMSNIILLGDMLYALAPDDSFIKELTYLGISTTLLELIKSNPIAMYFAIIKIILLLLSPLFAICFIAFARVTDEKYYNGLFKKYYGKSFINCSMRVFASTFVYFFMPLFISLGIKFTQMGTLPSILGAVILVLACVDCLIIEYHTFEFGDGFSNKNDLMVANYPYRLIDDLLIVVSLIIINATSTLISEFFGLAFIFLRLVCSIYFPFYNGRFQNTHQFILVSSLICSFGILIAHFDKDYYLFLIIIVFLVLLLAFTKIKREDNWQQLQDSELDTLDELTVIRVRLFKQACYVRVFRELIILSRKNNSHRTQLQIEILKSKCTDLETLNRGGVKKCSSEDVIHFEESIVQFFENFLKAAELSISIFKFIQHREGRKQILAKQVEMLIGYLKDNKMIIRKMLQLNQYSMQSRFLLAQTYGQFYQDHQFLKETEKWVQDLVGIATQKELKERFYSDKTTVIFINILEEVGKIVKISKNLPGVLGFIPSNLIGLSINEIIPFSIKPYHDENLIKFIEKCNDKDRYINFDLTFYAYNSEFHLQEVKVHYNWVMTDFNSFHMAGVIEKVDSDANIILTDEFGYLEGWTKKIGNEQFNFDQLSIAERKSFNIMPLFPTLIKYMDSLGVYARTLFFKNQKSRDQNLVITDPHKHQCLDNFQNNLLNTFRKMIKQEQIVGACFAEIEMTRISFCRGQANMIRFIIKNYERIENYSQISAMIQSLAFVSTQKTDKSIIEPTNELAEGSEKQQLSIFSEEEKTDRKIDSNFTLDPEGTHVFPLEQLVIGQFSSSRTSFQITSMYQYHLKKRVQKEDKNHGASHDTSFNPVLQKSNSLFFYVIVVTIAFIILVIFNITSVTSTGSLMETQCSNVITRNKAAMIYLKSIFNPNVTYIGQFVNGQLLENSNYLFSSYVNYTSFLGDIILENKYYLFNTQIPAALQRLLQNPINYSNQTVDIIPPTNAYYYKEIIYNYNLIIHEYDNKFSDALGIWSQNIAQIQSNFFIRLSFLCICSLLYIFLLILLYVRERKHKQTLQAFFKFQKEDLQRKIVFIGQIVKQIQSQVAEWHLLKEFNQIIKKEDITNLQFSLIKNTHEVKIKFDYDKQTESKLEKKKYYITTIIIILFIITQVIFLVLHSVTNSNALAYYKQTPYDLDSSAKLIVFPNYLLADLYLTLPADIKLNYKSDVAHVLSFPIGSVPNLYDLLSNVPCETCNFMYPVLTTNYKSFFSTFEQSVIQMKTSNLINNTQVEDLFYAADYVVSNILTVLVTDTYSYFDSSITVYAISLVILCAAIYWGTRSVGAQIEKLELFLNFFSEEMLTKNKHMNRLFSNTS